MTFIGKQEYVQKYFTSFLSIMLLLGTLAAVSMYKMQNLLYIEKRVSIWLKCCQQLNIPETTIKTVVPSKYVEFIKRGYINRFNYLFKMMIIKSLESSRRQLPMN